MDYRKEIEDLLTNYQKHKREIALTDELGRSNNKDKLKFLDYCISLLEGYQKELLYSLYINGMSIRRYSDNTGFSRNYITKERQNLLCELNKYFQIKYDSAV